MYIRDREHRLTWICTDCGACVLDRHQHDLDCPGYMPFSPERPVLAASEE